jgi:hypothetical protein
MHPEPSVKAQLFGSDGVKIDSEFLVNTATDLGQHSSTITGLANGGFVVTWVDRSGSLLDEGDQRNIKAQIFSAAGVKTGTEFLVNTETASQQDMPNIAALTNGGFAVTWTDFSGTLGDNIGTSIKAQIFSAAGVEIGTEFLVNTETASDQSLPTITGLANGGFVVTWSDENENGSLGDNDVSIKAQVFSAAGAKIGTEFLVNTQTEGFHFISRITGLANGDFVVT